MARGMSVSKRLDLLTRYRNRVEQSKKFREKDGYDALWKKCVDLYRGKHFPQAMIHTEDRIAVNLCFSTINVIAPSVSVNNPKIVVYSEKNQDGVKAVVIEAALNYWWRRYDFQSEFSLAVKDYLVIGHGWLKVGWRYVEEQRKTQAQEINRDLNEDGTEAWTPQDPREEPANEPDDKETDDNEWAVTQDRPFVERVSPHDIYVDPEAKTLAEAKWIAQKIVKPTAEVKQDKRYRLSGRKNVKPDAQINPDWRNDLDEIADDIQRSTIWEFYDMRLGTLAVFPEQGDEMLLDPIPQPYSFGHPFVMLRNYEVPDFFYPMGELEALEPLQMELDKTRSQLMNHRKAYDRKWLFRQDTLDPQSVSALQLDQDNVMVPVTADESTPLNDILVPLPINPPNPQLFQYAEGIVQDMNQVSGVSEFQQGQMPNIRHTATEASMMQDAATSRAADKLGDIEKVSSFVARRVLQLAQQYMTEDQEARILGKNGYPVWVPFSREQIQGQYDFEVEAGSTKPMNESQRRSQAMQLLQTCVPLAQSGLINVPELLRYVLAYGFQIKQPDKFLMQPQQQPGEDQKSPKQSIVETLNYKDAPPDIQRQMEQMAGFQPSEVGGSSPAEGHMAKVLPMQAQQQNQNQQQGSQQQAQQAQQMMQAQAQAQQQQAQQQHEHIQKSSDRAHEASMAEEDRLHQHALEHKKAQLQAAQAEQHHGHQMEQGEQQGEQQLTQTLLSGQQQQDQQEGPETTETGE